MPGPDVNIVSTTRVCSRPLGVRQHTAGDLRLITVYLANTPSLSTTQFAGSAQLEQPASSLSARAQLPLRHWFFPGDMPRQSPFRMAQARW
jgi:hypothetical protein